MNIIKNRTYGDDWVNGDVLKMVNDNPGPAYGDYKIVFASQLLCSGMAAGCPDICTLGGKCILTDKGNHQCGGRGGKWHWEKVVKRHEHNI